MFVFIEILGFLFEICWLIKYWIVFVIFNFFFFEGLILVIVLCIFLENKYIFISVKFDGGILGFLINFNICLLLFIFVILKVVGLGILCSKIKVFSCFFLKVFKKFFNWFLIILFLRYIIKGEFFKNGWVVLIVWVKLVGLFWRI